MSRKFLFVVVITLAVAVLGQPLAASVFPIVELTSFNPITGEYIYTVTCPVDSTYPFGYLQIDTQVANAAPTGPWILEGPLVAGVNKQWPLGWFSWDVAGKDSAYWDPGRAQYVPAFTYWQGMFRLVVPESQPVIGSAFTKDGDSASNKWHVVLVPGPKEVTPPDLGSPPFTSIDLDGTVGANDWYTSNVLVTITATDPDDDIIGTEYSFDGASWGSYEEPFEVTDEGLFTLIAISEDEAGNFDEEPAQVEFKIDKSAPEVSASVVGSPNANGWYNNDVVINYTAVDGVSGLASPSPAAPGVEIAFSHTVTTEGADVSDSGVAIDNAGNVGVANVTGLKIDKTAPAISVISAPTGLCHIINYELVVVQFSVSDNASGIDGLPSVVVSVQPTDGWVAPSIMSATATMVSAGVYQISFIPQVPGVYSVELFARDLAGNVGSASTAVTFGAGGFTVEWLPPISTMETYTMVDGSTVPVKFRLLDPCNNNSYVDTYPYRVSVVSSDGTVMLSQLVPVHDTSTGGYHVNVQTKISGNDNWPVGDYTVIITGPGIWDIDSGPYKSQYGLEIVEKAVAKGAGKR